MATRSNRIETILTLDSSGIRAGAAGAVQSMESMQASATSLAGTLRSVLGGAIAGFSAWSVIDQADEWGQYASRIKMATKSAEEYDYVQQRMVRSANATYRSIKETREAFIQTSPVLRSMGLSLQQSIDAVDTFSGLLVVNAASAERGKLAMHALSGAMQTGKLEADGWKTIVSAMPSIVGHLSTSLKKNEEEVRKLGASGQLTAQQLTQALVQANAAVMAQVDAMPTTVRDAFQNLSNAFQNYIGWQNEAYGVTASMASGVQWLGDNFETLAAGAGVVATVLGTRFVVATVASRVALLQQAIATAQATSQTTLMGGASTATAARMVVMTAASRAASTALAAFGGPVGLVLTAIAAVASGFVLFSDGADKARQSLLDMNAPLDEKIRQFRELNDLQREGALLQTQVDQTAAIKAQQAAWDELSRTVKVELSNSFRSAFLSLDDGGQKASETIARWQEKLEQASGSSSALRAVLDEMVAAGVIPESHRKRVVDLALAYDGQRLSAEGLTAELAALRAENAALNGEMAAGVANADGLTDVAQKYVEATRKRIAALEDAGDPVKEANRLIAEHTELTEKDIIEIRKAAAEQKAAADQAKANRANSKPQSESTLASIRAQIEAETELIARLREYGLEAENLTTGEKLVLKLQQELNGELNSRARATKELELLTAQQLVAAEQVRKSEQDQLKDEKEKVDAIERENQAARQRLENIQQQTALIGRQSSVLGSLQAPMEALKLQEAERALLAAQVAGESEAVLEKLRQQVVAQKEVVQAAAQLDYKTYMHSQQQGLLAAQEQGALLKYEATLIGRSTAERQKLLALRKIELDLAKKIEAIEQNSVWTVQEKADAVAAATAEAAQESANVVNASMLAAWDDVVNQMVETGRDVFTNLADYGSDTWKRLGQSLKASLLSALYDITARRWIINIAANITGAGGSGASGLMGGGGGGGGGLGLDNMPGLGLGGWLSGAMIGMGGSIGAFGAYMGAGAAMTAGTAGYTAASIGALFGAGNIAGGLGMLVGAIGSIMPVIGAIVAIASMLISPSDPHVGATGWYESGKDPYNTNYQGDKYNEDIGGGVQDLAAAVGETLQGFFSGMGLGDKDIRFGAGWVDDFDGSGPSFGDVKLYIDGEKFIDWQDLVGGSKEFSPEQQGFEEFVQEMLRDVIGALASMEDLPSWARDTLEAFDTANASAEELATLLGTVQQMSTVFQGWRENLVGFTDYTNEALSALLKAAGGFEALATAVGSYYSLYYSEAEQIALAQRQLTDALAEYGKELPDSKDAWRALVEEALAAGEEGAELAAVLLGLSEAFAQTVDAQTQLTMNMAGLSHDALVSGFIAEINAGRGAQAGVWLADTIAGGFEQAVYGKAIGTFMTAIIDGVVSPMIMASTTGASVSAAISGAAIETMVANATAAANALVALLNDPTWAAAMQQVNDLIRDLGNQMGAAIPPMSTYSGAVATLGSAASYASSSLGSTSSGLTSLSNEWERLIERMIDTVRDLRGEIAGGGEEGLAYWQMRYTVLTAQARAGDKDAAEQLPGLVSKLADLTADNAATRLDAQRAQAALAASLEETAVLLARQFGVSIPAFASGGSHFGGLAIVGENGPEVVNMGASNISSNQVLASLLQRASGGDNAAAAELRALRVEYAMGIKLMHRTMIDLLRLHQDWDRRGMPAVRKETVAA